MFSPQLLVNIDHNLYAVDQGSYTRTWRRFFSVQAQAQLVTSTYIDRGPGQEVYNFDVIMTDWPTSSEVYQAGIIQTWDVQKQNLENSYGVISQAILFIDPFGQQPNTPVASLPTPPPGSGWGIYFTQYVESIMPQSTINDPYIKVSVELQEAVGIVVSA